MDVFEGPVLPKIKSYLDLAMCKLQSMFRHSHIFHYTYFQMDRLDRLKSKIENFNFILEI